MTTGLPDPRHLEATFKGGIEGFLQRLLTGLIVGHEVRRYNHEWSPTERGRQFLGALMARTLGDGLDAEPAFVDEFLLPAREDAEKDGWPDYAVLWPGHLWLIELKALTGSHTSGQIERYLSLAAHHHPGRKLDFLYLTPPMPEVRPEPGDFRFGHIDWLEVAKLVTEVWADSPVADERDLAAYLTDKLHALYRDGAAEGQVAVDVAEKTLDEVLRLAAEVQRQQKQGAFAAEDVDAPGLSALRLAVRNAVIANREVDGTVLRHVQPWLWTAGESGGRAKTPEGEVTGLELRLSFMAAAWRREQGGGGA